MFLLLLLTITIGQPLQKIYPFGIAQCQTVSRFFCDLVHLQQILANQPLEISHRLLKILKSICLLKGSFNPFNHFLLFEILLLARVVLLPQPLQNFVTLRKYLRHYNYRAPWNKSQINHTKESPTFVLLRLSCSNMLWCRSWIQAVSSSVFGLQWLNKQETTICWGWQDWARLSACDLIAHLFRCSRPQSYRLWSSPWSMSQGLEYSFCVPSCFLLNGWCLVNQGLHHHCLLLLYRIDGHFIVVSRAGYVVVIVVGPFLCWDYSSSMQ